MLTKNKKSEEEAEAEAEETVIRIFDFFIFRRRRLVHTGVVQCRRHRHPSHIPFRLYSSSASPFAFQCSLSFFLSLFVYRIHFSLSLSKIQTVVSENEKH